MTHTEEILFAVAATDQLLHYGVTVADHQIDFWQNSVYMV